MRVFVALLFLAFLIAPAQVDRYDIIIRNGHVIDGAGNPWYPADVAIKGGRVHAIRARIDAPAELVINAARMAVTPGFIDMHTHSEYTLLRDGNAQSKIRQGVTLEVVGEGSSSAPRRADMDQDLRRAGVTERWTTFREYFDILNSKGLSVNLMSYVAAGQLRRMVVGEDFRKPSAEELEQMKSLAHQAMEDGAIGLVSALETTTGAHPDAVSDTNELIELARVVSAFGGMYGSHMRNQTDHFIEAVDETGTIAERANVRA